jgi:trk system potassium uptake protein TrkA
VAEDAPAAGRQIGELELPDGCLVVSVLRDGAGFVPKADTLIQPGDEVLAVLSPGDEAAVCELFAPKALAGGGSAVRRPA